MESWVRRRDDGTDGLLVESLVAFASLQVFEVAPEGAVTQELRVLLGTDPAISQAAIGPELGHRPALALGEGLAEEREVGEGGHDLDPGFGLEVVAECIEVELGLEVMHPSLKDRLAVKCHPEANRVRSVEVGQGGVGKVVSGLIGGEVEVGEDHDPGRWVLDDLGSPTGVFAGVEPLAEHESELLEHGDHAREESA